MFVAVAGLPGAVVAYLVVVIVVAGEVRAGWRAGDGLAVPGIGGGCVVVVRVEHCGEAECGLGSGGLLGSHGCGCESHVFGCEEEERGVSRREQMCSYKVASWVIIVYVLSMDTVRDRRKLRVDGVDWEGAAPFSIAYGQAWPGVHCCDRCACLQWRNDRSRSLFGGLR